MKQHRPAQSASPVQAAVEPVQTTLEPAAPTAIGGGPGGGVATAPPPDGVPVDSVLALAARSFGRPLDVQIHLASPLAAQAGSAGITIGDAVHVHPMATGPDGSVSESLLAHELVHWIQQAQSGPAAGTAALEGEAHAQADALLAGEPLSVSAAAPGTPQHLTLVEWFDGATAGDVAPDAVIVEDAETEGTAPSEADLLIGDTAPYTPAELVEPTVALVGASLADVVPPDGSEQGGSTTTDDGQVVTTETETETELVATDEGVSEETTVSYDRTTLDFTKGSLSSATGTETTSYKALDEEAKKAVALQDLKDRLSDLNSRVAADGSRVAELDQLIDDATVDPDLSAEETEALVAGYRAERDRVAARHAEASATAGKLGSDVAALEGGQTDLVTIEGDYEIDYSGASTQTAKEESSWKVGLDGVTLARSSFEGDGSGESESLQISTSGVTLATTDKDAAGTETKNSGGVDLATGVGADVSQTETHKDGSSTAVRGSVDVVYDEKKGLQGLKGAVGLTVKGDDGASASVDIRQTMTKDEVGLGGDLGGKQEIGDEKRGGSFGVKLSGDAGITATAEPQPDGTYQLSIRIYGKLGIGASAEAHAKTENGDVKAGGEASATASEELTFTRLLDRDAALAYLGKLEAGEGAEYPEFGWVAKLRAGAEGFESGWDDPDVAADMAVGESYSFKTTLGAKLCLSTGWGWVGGQVGVSGSGSWAQSVSQQADGAHWSQAMSTTLGATADGTLTTGDGVSAEAGYAETTTVGVTASGVLDLSTEAGRAHYAAVMGAASVDALLAAARAAGGSIAESNGESLTTKIGVGLGPVSVGTEQTSETHENVEVGPDGMKAGVGGSSGETVTVEVGDTPVAKAGEHDAAELKVDQEGIEGEFTETGTSTGGGDGDVTAGEVLAKGLPAALTEALFAEEKHLLSYQVSKADMQVVIDTRAPDRANWERCCGSVQAFEPWRQLRARLVSPVPVAEYARDYPNEATWLAQARAIASFMANSSADGFECWENVLRNFGDAEEQGASADLGERSEWPADMADTHKAYDAAMAAAAKLPDLYQAALADKAADPDVPFDYDGVDSASEAVVDALDEVVYQILASDSFDSVGARSEMADRVNDQIATVREQWATCLGDAASLDPAGEDDGMTCRDDSALEEPARLDSQIAEALSVLRSNKFAEDGLVAEVGREQGWLETTVAYELAADATLREAKDLWQVWRGQILSLRGLYTQRDLPEGEWKVSAGPSIARRPDFEPDLDRFVDAYFAAHGTEHVDVRKWEALRGFLGNY